MSIEQNDLEAFERLIYKSGDDVAVSISRSFQRLEERLDAAESRIYNRLADVEDRIEGNRQDLSDELGLVRDSVREIARANDQPGDADPVEAL